MRPILMTAFATCRHSAHCDWLGAGRGKSAPMGIAVVGGMLTSTFLTLFIVPVVYTFFSDVARNSNPVHSRKSLPGGSGSVGK